jgi:hypothetical protein
MLIIAAASCTSVDPGHDTGEDTTPPVPRVKGPEFNADSAFFHLKAQVNFGPRVPGTPAHAQTAEYFIRILKAYGMTVETQSAPSTRLPLTGETVALRNVMGKFHPERKDRILLLAHWDTRPYADMDPDTSLRKKPFDGADDGASGPAALLEIARLLNEKDPNIGVDILFVDGEDSGTNLGPSESWCLGTQYWAQHLPGDYTARFAILLDMVGGRGAVFPREGTSVDRSPEVVEKVWSAAANLGYGNYFVNTITGPTTDDHLFVNEITGIPAIDIVHYDPVKHDYAYWHHRHSDNLEIIDVSTLKMVGTVVVDVIYNEMPPKIQ